MSELGTDATTIKKAAILEMKAQDMPLFDGTPEDVAAAQNPHAPLIKDLYNYALSLRIAGSKTRLEHSREQQHKRLIGKAAKAIKSKAGDYAKQGLSLKQNQKLCQVLADEIADALNTKGVFMRPMKVG
jgi:hypothetical protein